VREVGINEGKEGRKRKTSFLKNKRTKWVSILNCERGYNPGEDGENVHLYPTQHKSSIERQDFARVSSIMLILTQTSQTGTRVDKRM
jgi:hypothetical protein